MQAERNKVIAGSIGLGATTWTGHCGHPNCDRSQDLLRDPVRSGSSVKDSAPIVPAALWPPAFRALLAYGMPCCSNAFPCQEGLHCVEHESPVGQHEFFARVDRYRQVLG